MLTSPRRSDDADVIRARLRVLLDEGGGPRGWLPDDEDDPALVGELAPAPDPDDEPDDDDDEASWDAGTVPVPAGRHAPGRPVRVDRLRVDRLRAALPDGLGRHRAPGAAARVDPGRPGAWAMWVVGLLAALAVAGWSWLGRPDVEPVPAGVDTVPAATADAAPGQAPASGQAPAPGQPPGTEAGVGPSTPAVVVVSVVGLVRTPGLVSLPTGSRVADALTAAGGLLPEADPASVNAAALVVDGQQIAVGVPGAAAAPTAAGAATSGPVDLNTATVADLDALPGIGPVLAQRIVDHRTSEGPFTSIDQLDDVEGIGPVAFEELAPLVRV
ncbi:competence protein ComEA [Modestobacter sp. I12A-02628]|uniref:Competence protein ComEA n=1 Tax=Goekera deserti TaxID=2497753 RepID=A0A7K3WBE3_9ACTN|nr:ComEA family DNA-binding protein [Goekera deserti]MPQ97463.1 competence protein ComEA [Goekera deserti]NDI47936.1 competence protein ComEA [Goekera deserti]NEL53684.1 competence protein ComEA [Goekera deserti]